jgi:hypothetical protein
MHSVGFEPTVPASERAKTVRALDRSATVTGRLTDIVCIYFSSVFHSRSVPYTSSLHIVVHRESSTKR